MNKNIAERIEVVKTLTQLLPNLKDPHAEFVLLRACFSLPKVMYLLRTIDPSIQGCLHNWTSLDNLIHDSLTNILGSPVDQVQWKQAQLPMSMASLGLRGAHDHTASAYVTSVLSTETLQSKLLPHSNYRTDLTRAIFLLSTKTNEDESRESLVDMSQKAVSLKVDLNNQQILAGLVSSVWDKARLASLSLKHSGDALTVVPNPVLGLHIRPQEFRFTIMYRLGIPVYPAEGPCPACHSLSDKFGDHAISCGTQGERIARHNSLRDALFQVTPEFPLPKLICNRTNMHNLRILLKGK